MGPPEEGASLPSVSRLSCLGILGPKTAFTSVAGNGLSRWEWPDHNPMLAHSAHDPSPM